LFQTRAQNDILIPGLILLLPFLLTLLSRQEMLVINFCCFKYGCKDFPNLYTDKLIASKWFCIDCSIGFGNMNFLSNQCFCVKT
jgi:hypothetical protein